MYVVRPHIDNNYKVVNEDVEQIMFIGSLSDCEAWIRLTEDGYLDEN